MYPRGANRILTGLAALLLASACVTADPSAWREVPARASGDPVTPHALGKVVVTASDMGFGSGDQQALRGTIERTLRGSGIFQGTSGETVDLEVEVQSFSRPLMSFGGFRSTLELRVVARTSGGEVVYEDQLTGGGVDDTGSQLGPVRASRAKTLAVADAAYALRNALEPALRARAPLPPPVAPPPVVVAAREPEPSDPFDGEVLVAIEAPAPGTIEPGSYHALVIGNNRYANLPALRTATNDANALSALLRDQYGYTVHTLLDATRSDILRQMASLRASLGRGDSLLVYYAGHGWFDEGTRRGYWLPVDAQQDDPSNWVSAADVTDLLRAMDARHVMVIADSCYSGALTRGLQMSSTSRNADYVRRLASKRARVVLTSGGLEPVEDGAGEHSVFARALLDALGENDGVLEGAALFTRIRRPVILNAAQTPEYGDIRFADHQGGDFLFIRPR